MGCYLLDRIPAILNNNFENALDGQTLINFTSFVNFDVFNCDISRNEGDYLLNLGISGAAVFRECSIDENNIDEFVINIMGKG